MFHNWILTTIFGIFLIGCLFFGIGLVLTRGGAIRGGSALRVAAGLAWFLCIVLFGICTLLMMCGYPVV